ncbi:MAG: 5'/3'-nucleotidase SurE [Thermodesulfobacteriota bacterium]|nr:5'/3'-nucleotidase SurE [Thermodesulfobacteriota bacterium]
MKILLTNDDGYSTPGILALYKTLGSYHEVTLIAPDREKSAVSHGITLNEPMRIDKVNNPDPKGTGALRHLYKTMNTLKAVQLPATNKLHALK